jgi:lipopolysaccharide/colanic/teichoic acid biosynthesis glycosyltransferase
MARSFDIFFAGAGLVLLAPALIAISLAIALGDGRPVLFRQQRVGRGGKLFTILKFRSMRPGPAGAAITGATDSRITRLGKFLRDYKLDELPQLWNVLAGDMSLVGPRPEVPRFVDMKNDHWKQVLSTAPGITDFASLMYRSEEQLLASVEDLEGFYREKILPEKLALNLKYLGARNFRSDMRLIALTAWYSVFPARCSADRVRNHFFREVS